ncbi:alpha/beta fold hydrolase [Nocardia lijiangensis]|uniref:alpha/beta fold hydrolase n=1 Tax=Nocardia lijiangensis TaxID=299618 RepID=UPI003D706754
MLKIGRFTNDKAKAIYLDAYDTVAARWPMASTEFEIETSFGTTHVRKSGSGEGAPLLLLPSLGGNALFWTPFIQELARDRVVFACDVLGWAGRSEQTAPLRTEADLAQWGAELVRGLGAGRVHLVGYSQGAWLAAVIGAYHSGLLASLSLLEPAPVTFAKPSWKILRRFLVAGMRPTRAAMEKFNEWLTPGVRLGDQEWEMLLAGFKFRPGVPWLPPLAADRFAAITTPLLVLFGGDTVVHDPQLAADRVRQRVPTAEIEIYPGVGHELIWATPEQVITRLLGFVSDHDRAKSPAPQTE